ncbi:MAG: SGNH hydrolase domain-containing protein [Candidatus Limnocylindrales bacterium]
MAGAPSPAAPFYQAEPGPVEPAAPEPVDPWELPRPGVPDAGYVPPAEYQQLPGESPFAQQPPTYGDQQRYGVQPGEGEPQLYGVQAPYQNQYADPTQPVMPGPYAGAGTPPPSPTDTEETADEGKSYFRKDVEGLRAVAILAVLLFHVGVPYFDGGFVGVDVFYVISGFLITGLLLREGERSGKVDLLRFYARRMRRLLPAALLVIVVTLVLSALIVSPLRLTEIAGDAAASALYVANFRFAFEATDYLATLAQSPFLHFWSLGVEEQFYLFWPLILLAAVRFLPGRLLGLFMLVLAIASFALSFVWTSTMPEWAFFSPLTRAWELAAGALIAVGLLRFPQRVPRIAGSIAVVVGLLLIAASVLMGGILGELDLGNDDLVNALFASTESPFPGVAALLPVLGAVLVIMGGSHSRTLVGRFVLGNPVSRYIGRISYSLYLWHWPILILVPIALGVDDLTTRLALAGVSIVLAILSTELWERPWRRSGALDRRSAGTVRLGLVGSVGVGATALLMSGAIVLPSNIELPWIQPPKVVAELAGVRNDLPAHYDDGCHLLGYGRAKLMTDCVYGDPEGEQTAMLVGDSHAAQWLPALDAYAAEQGWRLEVHTKAACAVIDVPVWERSQRSVFDRCINWRDKVQKHIRQTKPEVVYVGLSRDYELWNGTVIQSSDATTYWREQLTSYLASIGKPAAEVVLLAETPFLNYDPVDCLADPGIASCDPPTNRVVDRDYAALERRAASDAGAQLLSINDLLCDESTCPVVVDDDVVFRDNHHLTASYMERLAEPIGNLLEGRPAYPTPAPTLTPASPAADGV